MGNCVVFINTFKKAKQNASFSINVFFKERDLLIREEKREERKEEITWLSYHFKTRHNKDIPIIYHYILQIVLQKSMCSVANRQVLCQFRLGR